MLGKRDRVGIEKEEIKENGSGKVMVGLEREIRRWLEWAWEERGARFGEKERMIAVGAEMENSQTIWKKLEEACLEYNAHKQPQ
ncbi:hypothetical protein ACH5RR_036815 [Cinchona calisaya]|uniref:Uncharacterized protein n=1 Tax=Cinchona calisaya TaxID=153742 RepID=A0ABD2Y5Q5_9GENT